MRNQDQRPARATSKEATTRHRPAGATSTGGGEPLPGAEKKEATTRQRPAGATSTGGGEPLHGAEKALGGLGKVEDGESLTAAEDEESRLRGRRGQPLRGPRTGSHRLEPKMSNQDHGDGARWQGRGRGAIARDRG